MNRLKNNISLNVLSLLGYLGIITVLYIVFCEKISEFIPKAPYISLSKAFDFYTCFVAIFFFLLLLALLEFFVKKLRNFGYKEAFAQKHLSTVHSVFFVTGLLIVVIAVLVFISVWIIVL